tara:strand:- start:84 stop:773 length:690 start_codon:yes stop_codon:yes gene_type:complete
MELKVKKTRAPELLVRSLSALVIMPFVIGAIILGFPYYNIMILICSVILFWEFFLLCDKRLSWGLIGIIYIGLSSYALIKLRATEIMGLETVITLFFVVWASDTGAFVFGKLIGGKKLAPKISPNKTWSGFFGGILSAFIIGGLVAFILSKDILLYMSLISVLIGTLSQAGDLLESWLKRRFNKKDSGSLIPGHGGLFDRVDGLLPAATALWLGSFWFSEKSFLLWTKV